MKQPRVRPPSARVSNMASHERDPEPSFGFLTTDELAPPPADIGDAPMTRNENGTGAESLEWARFTRDNTNHVVPLLCDRDVSHLSLADRTTGGVT
jgi:hypothetical protein